MASGSGGANAKFGALGLDGCGFGREGSGGGAPAGSAFAVLALNFSTSCCMFKRVAAAALAIWSPSAAAAVAPSLTFSMVVANDGAGWEVGASRTAVCSLLSAAF